MDESQIGRMLSTGFSPHQIGYVATYVQPLTSHDTVEQFIAAFDEHPDIGCIPVESTDGLMKIVRREQLDGARGGSLMGFFSHGIDRYLTSEYGILDAREHLEAVLSAKYADGGEPQRHHVVFHRGRYFGVVDIAEILRAVFRLREYEIGRAREIQQHLLRPSQWDDAPYNVHTYLNMAYELGGDFYYRSKIDKDRELVACFDVSGKNISAALSTSLIASFFSTLEVEDRMNKITPEQIIRFANSVLFRQTTADMFVAAIVIFVDRQTCQMTVYNHGYAPLIVIRPAGMDRDPRVELFEPMYAPLGIEDEIDLEGGGTAVELSDGTRIFSFSDGLPDAQDPAGRPYGEERVVALAAKCADMPGTEFVQTVREEITAFIGDAPRTDDITAILLSFDEMEQQ